MRYYETLYIVNPTLENEALDTTMGEIGTELEKTKSKLINHRVWGKKRLAYQIDKQKYGSYILLQFEGGEQDKMNEFDTWMKLNNTVLRHLTVALDDKPEIYVEDVKEEPPSEEPASEESVEAITTENDEMSSTEETQTETEVSEETDTESETSEEETPESNEEELEEKEAE